MEVEVGGLGSFRDSRVVRVNPVPPRRARSFRIGCANEGIVFTVKLANVRNVLKRVDVITGTD